MGDMGDSSVRIKGEEMLIFWKIWRALFSCYLRLEIRPSFKFISRWLFLEKFFLNLTNEEFVCLLSFFWSVCIMAKKLFSKMHIKTHRRLH